MGTDNKDNNEELKWSETCSKTFLASRWFTEYGLQYLTWQYSTDNEDYDNEDYDIEDSDNEDYDIEDSDSNENKSFSLSSVREDYDIEDCDTEDSDYEDWQRVERRINRAQ